MRHKRGPSAIAPASEIAPPILWTTVRLPLSENFWLYGYSTQNCTSSQYQGLVKSTVDALTSLKLNVILSLHWTDAGGQYGGRGAGFQMPDNDSVLFWTQVAKLYSGYSNVLFELHNEPHPHTYSVPNQNIWACWQKGCQITNDDSIQGSCNCTSSYVGVGLQTLVNTVRNAGANNLVLVGGTNWGFDLSQLGSYPITGANVIYDSHPYPYTGKNTTAEWDAASGKYGNLHPPGRLWWSDPCTGMPLARRVAVMSSATLAANLIIAVDHGPLPA